MSNQVRAVFCGGLDWWRARKVIAAIDALPRDAVMIVPACRGAGIMAREIGRGRGREMIVVGELEPKPSKHYVQNLNAEMLTHNPTIAYVFKQNFDHSLLRGGCEHFVKLANGVDLEVLLTEEP